MDTVATQYVGIDVTKSRLGCALLQQNQQFLAARLANDADRHVEVLKGIAHHAKDRLVVVQAMGGYEAAMVAKLFTSAVAVAVVNPRQVRDFAKATGALAKTDAIDAVCWRSSVARYSHPRGRRRLKRWPSWKRC